MKLGSKHWSQVNEERMRALFAIDKKELLDRMKDAIVEAQIFNWDNWSRAIPHLYITAIDVKCVPGGLFKWEIEVYD